jgi:hypothetical protein
MIAKCEAGAWRNGKRTRLKILRRQWLAGSSPAAPTKSSRDFKSPTYPNEVNDLGGLRKHF